MAWFVTGLLVLAILLCLGEAVKLGRTARVSRLVSGASGSAPEPGAVQGSVPMMAQPARTGSMAIVGPVLLFARVLNRLTPKARFVLLWASIGLLAAAIGMLLAGPVGSLLGGGLGAGSAVALDRRKRRRRNEMLERQLAEVVEATALAIRSGLSIVQAMDFAEEEVSPPMKQLLAMRRTEQGLGTPFEEAVNDLATALSTDDARLFVLVMSIHARSGGNLGVALDEVSATIRHRMTVRRELRALSAQGRISGAVLGILPIAFFLVLAVTSHRELAPVYRSAPGVAMIVSGLILQALAYLWIRRLMRVDV